MSLLTLSYMSGNCAIQSRTHLAFTIRSSTLCLGSFRSLLEQRLFKSVLFHFIVTEKFIVEICQFGIIPTMRHVGCSQFFKSWTGTHNVIIYLGLR